MENLQPNQMLTLNMEKLDTGHILRDSETVNLCLNIQIGRGPDGVWCIRHTSLVGPTGDLVLGPIEPARQVVKPTALKEPVNKPIQPVKANNLVWRPRVGAGPSAVAGPCLPQGQSETRASKTALLRPRVGAGPSAAADPCLPRGQIETRASETSLPDSSTQLNQMVLVAPNQEQPMLALDTPSGDAFVNCTWGSSSDWVLELRDGRRISIPLSLLRSPRGDLEDHDAAGDSPFWV